MTIPAINVAAIEPAWKSFQSAMPAFGPIHGEEHYNSLVEVLNSLLDVVGDDENHPMAKLLELTGNIIENYEKDLYAIPDASPRDVLKFLMTSHHLKQSDLAIEIGGQSVVSEILSGDREINVRQAKALASKFGVSASVFI